MCLHVTTGPGLLGMCVTVPGMGRKWEQHGCDWHVLPVAWESLPCGLVALHGQGSLMIQLLEYAGPHWGPVHCFVVVWDSQIQSSGLALPSATQHKFDSVSALRHVLQSVWSTAFFCTIMLFALYHTDYSCSGWLQGVWCLLSLATWMLDSWEILVREWMYTYFLYLYCVVYVEALWLACAPPKEPYQMYEIFIISEVTSECSRV